MAPTRTPTQCHDRIVAEGVWLALALAVLTAALVLPSIRGIDGACNYVYLMSIVNDGDLDFSNEYATFDLERGGPLSLVRESPVSPITGRPANRYGVGSAFFWAPGVILVHLTLELVSPEWANGHSPPYAWAVALSSAFWGCLGVWLLYMRLRESFPRAPSALAVAALQFATPLGFYVWMHGSMSHAVSFFVSVMAMLAAERALTRPSRLAPAVLGFWTGLLVATRMQDITWAVALGAGLLPPLRPSPIEETDRTGKPSPARLAASASLFILTAALAFLPQMAAWKALYGSWLSGPLPYLNREAGGFSRLPIHLPGVLFSERGGALAWHPMLIAAVAGLVALAIRRSGSAPTPASELNQPSQSKPERRLALLGLVGLGLQLYLVSSWSVWWGGASFGNRFFISSYPWLCVGLASAIDSIQRRTSRWLAPVAVAALILWNAGLLIQYGTEMIPREENVGWRTVIVNQFTAVPEWLLDRVLRIL